MDKLTKAALLPSGELTPCANTEQKLLSVPSVSLVALPKGSAATRSGGVLVITTHRIAWLRADRRGAVAAPLSILRSAPLEHVSSLRTTRAELHFADRTRLRLEFSGSNASGRRDQARAQLNAAHARKQWEIDAQNAARAEAKRAAAAEEAARPKVGAEHAGIGGAIRRVEARAAARDTAINTGFESLAGLRAAAEELLVVARALQGAGAPAGKETKENNALLDAMAAAGIPAPVTRATVSGDADFYRDEVAREAATFLADRLPALGGLVTVADAYALVMRNRASAELVSPSDFAAAMQRLERLNVGLRVIKLPGGVGAIECDVARGKGADALLELVSSMTSAGAVDVARARNVPLSRALRMLEDAEQAGLLARDDTDGVLRFFPNRFTAFTNAAKS